MNWYSSPNSFSNNTLKSGLVSINEINLRQEMHDILYGTVSSPAKGHWIVYRKYDRTSKSLNFSERTQEGVGGPAYNYTDTLMRSRRVPSDRTGLPLDSTKAGMDITDKYIYYIEYTFKPAIGDHIFELDLDDHTNRPVQSSLIFTDRYQIKRTHDYRLENGNVQYYIVSCDYDEANY